MKKLLGLISVIALTSCGGGGERTKSRTFELAGNFANANGETIYLEKLNSQQPMIVDSATIDEKGNFVFNMYTPSIGFYRIKMNEKNFAMMVLDSTDKITVSGNAKDLGNSYKIQGSPETNLFLEYNDLAKYNRGRVDSLQQLFQADMQSRKLDSLRMDSLSKHYEGIFNTIIDGYSAQIAEKIKANASSFASIMAIQPLDPEKYSDVYKALDEGLQKRYPDNENVRMFHSMVRRQFATKSGTEAPEIFMKTPEGKDLALSSFRGKIVLIDFWASWCGPCRKEMPHVKEIYAKYKNKGFEIFGVSLDKEGQDWVAAIKKDGLTWPQVSDLKFWESEAAKLYNVQSIPYTVIVDKEGKILAKGLRGHELEKALEDIFSGKNPGGGSGQSGAYEMKKPS